MRLPSLPSSFPPSLTLLASLLPILSPSLPPALTSTSLPGFGITTVLADYATTLLYVFKLLSLYPSEIRATNAEGFLRWWRRAWRQEKRMKRRQEEER